MSTEKNSAPVVIDVRNVKKKFRIYKDRGNTLKERLLFAARRKNWGGNMRNKTGAFVW